MIKIIDNDMLVKQIDSKMFLAAFGRRMKQLRKQKGEKFSQEKLSETSNLHRNYISDAERGTRNVSLVAICKIIQGLDVSIAEFFAEGFD